MMIRHPEYVEAAADALSDALERILPGLPDVHHNLILSIALSLAGSDDLEDEDYHRVLSKILELGRGSL